MKRVFNYRERQPTVWFSKNVARSNQYCPYCGRFVGLGSSIPSDREHLIGRNFVPAGSLDGGAFNFIFRACVECNAEKGEAERHISSVSLFNSPGRASDENVDAIAKRKAAGDYHPATRKLVHESLVQQQVKSNFGAIKSTFNLIGPPQLDVDAVLLLACRQVQAFFALLTSENPRARETSRVLPAPNVLIFDHFTHSDWGNPELVELENRTRAWPRPLCLVSAHGYFRATLRRSDDLTEGLFWALEWNRSLRVVGAIGDPAAPPTWLRDLPQPKWFAIPSPTGRSRIRLETPLSEREDRIFLPDREEPSAGH